MAEVMLTMMIVVMVAVMEMAVNILKVMIVVVIVAVNGMMVHMLTVMIVGCDEGGAYIDGDDGWL